MSETRRFIKNAAYNVINGLASAIFAILLPYFFVRQFTPEQFSIWILVLQVAAYATYLNFGLQVAVGRYVAQALELDDQDLAGRIVAAAMQILGVLACAGFLMVLVIAAVFPSIFHQVPAALVPSARMTLLWTGSAVALGLPATAFLGAFAGLQRNDIPAWISAGGKTVLAAGLILAATLTHDLVIVGITYFVLNILTYIVQYAAYRRFCGHWKISLLKVRPGEIRELVSYCTSLVVWVLAMLLINGMDTTIVGLFDFAGVAAYGIAISIVSFFAGVVQALLSPLIQIFTKLHVRDDPRGLMKLLHLSAFGATLFMVLMACAATSIAEPAFTIWVGPDLARKAVPLFCILVFANVFRYSLLPFTNYLIATGLQKKVLLSPAAEGIANFLFGIVAVRYIGAVGVACGTMFGAVLTLGINHFHNFPRTTPPGFSVRNIIWWNLGRPILLASVGLAALLLKFLGLISLMAECGMIAVGFVIAIAGALPAYKALGKQFGSGPISAGPPLPDMPPT